MFLRHPHKNFHPLKSIDKTEYALSPVPIWPTIRVYPGFCQLTCYNFPKTALPSCVPDPSRPGCLGEITFLMIKATFVVPSTKQHMSL